VTGGKRAVNADCADGRAVNADGAAKNFDLFYPRNLSLIRVIRVQMHFCLAEGAVNADYADGRAVNADRAGKLWPVLSA
jgi:hypothetical protein